MNSFRKMRCRSKRFAREMDPGEVLQNARARVGSKGCTRERSVAEFQLFVAPLATNPHSTRGICDPLSRVAAEENTH